MKRFLRLSQLEKTSVSVILFSLFCFTAKAQFPLPYCNITFTSNVEPITLVQFAGINQSSGAPLGTGGPLENYTAVTGNVIAGNTYPISLKGNTDGNFTTHLRVFIDFNNNNVLNDVGESFYIGTIVNSTGTDAITLTGNITIPVSATAGPRRMRVMKRFSTDPTNPCQTGSGFGQGEDYTLNVALPAPCSGAPTAGTITAPAYSFCGAANTTLTLSGSSYGTIAGIEIQWQSSPTGAIWTDIGTLNSTTYTVTNVTSSTLYRARVRCTTAPVADVFAGPILINVNPNPVVGINPATSFICGTGSSTLNALGAATYAWSPATGLSGTTGATVTANPATSTVYTVTGTLGSCSATATTFVNVAPVIPTVTATATPSTVCSGGSTSLSTIQPGSTYSMYYIPTVPQTIPTPATATLGDDNSFLTTMPFPFTYFGTSYTDLIIASNGYVGFTNVDMGNRFVTTIPAAGTPNNCIYAFWKDLNPNTSGNVTYGVAGVAPNRRFIVSFNAVADFGATAPFAAGNTHSGQIILYETSNVIDVIITNSSSGTRTLGIENAAGSFAIAPPGKNNATWAVASPGEAFRFAPPVFNYAWTPAGGLSNATVYNPTASNITANTTFNVAITDPITGCTGAGNTSVTVNPLPTAAMTTSTPTVCAGSSPTLNFTGTPNANVVYSINGVNQPAVTLNGSGSGTTTPAPISANTAYALVSVTNPATTCSATLSGGFTVNIIERPVGQFTGTSIVCKDAPAFIGFGSPSGGTVFPIYVTYSDGTNTYLDTAAGAGENFPVPSNIPGIYNYNITALSSANGCNAIAGDFSGTATMEVKALPTAVVSSADPGVCPGGSTDVTLTFTGDAPFSFLYYDGTATVGNTTSTNSFTFTATPTETDTFYVQNLLDNNVCLATPAELADSAIVVVYDTTTITSQPAASLSACSQTAVTITMSAIGQNPVYTWYENGVAITPGPNYTINNNSLTINNVTGMGGNTYYVVVHSDCGNDQTSSTTTLTEDLSNSWSGTVSTDWNNPVNWSCNSVPIATTDVTITQGAPNMPVVEIPTAVCHDITLIGTASLTFVAGMQLSVYGDIANTTGGTINGTGGTIELAGTVQSVSGPVTLENLEVNGGGVKTFSTDVTVTGILNLVSGNIELGTGTLTLAQPTAQLGGSPTSFIVTNGTGRVIGNNMGAVGGNPDEVTFHVGINGTSYTPITLENLGDADNFSVRVMENVYEDGTGVIPTEVDNPVVDRTWLVEEGTAGGSIVTMTPAWNSTGDEVNGFVTTNVFVAHYLNGEWTSYVDSANAAPAADPGPYAGMLQTTQDSIMSFSPFTVASSGQFPLTIHLNSITATNVGPRNKVEWKSEKEDVGDSYELERSADGRKFTKMTTVAANGQPSTYTQWDEQPVMGVNYYRVKLLNNDGSYSYSRVVTATVKGQDGFSIEAYPNPVKNMVSVKIDGVVSGKATIAVTDVTGKIVKTATAVVNNAAELNVSELASGVYLINYTDEVRNESIKITKQ